MIVLDVNADSIVYLNTPARIERIDKFTIETTMRFFDGVQHVVFSCSEEVVIETASMENINNIIKECHVKYGDNSIITLDERLTKFFRMMLLYCRMRFPDEVSDEPYNVLTDKEVLQLENERYLVHEIEED